MKDHKKKYGNLWIAKGAITVVILAFLLIFFNSYVRNKTYFVSEINDVLETSVKQLNGKLVEKRSRGMVSSHDDSTFLIIRENNKYIFSYDKKMDINSNFYRAIYDIVPLNSWNIEHLAKIIRHEMSNHCPPFVLMRIDSVGHPMDTYEFDLTNGYRNNLQYEYTIPLGFLDKHQLKVYYTYPWQIFWDLEGKILLVIFLLLLLVATCIGLFVKLLWNARKKAENQELFVQALNHDLKSPVAALQMRMYQIKDYSITPYSPEQNELYDQTLQQIEDILASADRVLQDSIDARGIHLDLQEANLQELIKKQVTNIEKAVDNKKKVKIDTYFQLSDPMIHVDVHHFSRMIQNLLQNAVKYSGENVHIQITCQEKGKFVQISLQDDGIGIVKSELKRIFETNYRSRTIAPSKIKGYGIGLSYVKMIVKAHRGTIQVESEPGKKTVFIIKLKYGRKN